MSATPPSDDDIVPLFGTWRAIYTSVFVTIVLVIALVFVFSRFPY